MNPLLERISVDPNVCFGKPCIRGTRIWVSLILDFLADGMSMQEIQEEYPQLTSTDILAAIAYGAEMSRQRYVDIPQHVALLEEAAGCWTDENHPDMRADADIDARLMNLRRGWQG